MRKTIFKLLSGMLCTLLMFACSEDEYDVGVKPGEAAQLRVTIQVPATDNVIISRGITEQESAVSSLQLYAFSTNGSGESWSATLNVTPNGFPNSEGYLEYTTVDDIVAKSGTYNIYAIANYNGSVTSEDDARALVAEGAINAGSLPMSAVIENKTIFANEGPEAKENSLDIKLVRATAHIEFIFGAEGDGVTFTPESYTIKNAPTGGNLFDYVAHAIEAQDGGDIKSIENGGYAFEFFMYENRAGKGTNITSQAMREMYSGDHSNYEFTNAPQTATYVVVKGYYEDKAQRGPVEYTIHLGNFSSTGSVDNFDVNRNEYHKYTVTVKGVNNVSTKMEIKNPGAYSDDINGKNISLATALKAQDAHYVIYPIEINVENINQIEISSDASWLTINVENGETGYNDNLYLAKQGFWTDEEKGAETISTASQTGKQTVYLFLDENLGETTRKATVTVKQKDAKQDAATISTTFDIEQLSAAWNGTTGLERFEEGDIVPWGFKYDRNVTYKMGPVFVNVTASYFFERKFGSLTGDYYTFTQTGLWILGVTCTINIDYNKLTNFGTIFSNIDGLSNTKTVNSKTTSGYGIDAVENFAQNYVSLTGSRFKVETETGDLEIPSDYAVYEAIKKNKFSKVIDVNDNGETNVYASIAEEDIKWYLPASEELASLSDSEYPLEGSYWTSTANDDNSTAKVFITPSTIKDDDRKTAYKIRAVRSK